MVAVVAAAAAGAAAAQADDAWARRGRGPRGRRWQMTSAAGRLGSMAFVALSEAEKVYIVHGVQVAAAAVPAPAVGFP